MKKNIHPDYKVITVTCGCGNTFQTRSTRDTSRLEVCSECHPFYTGKNRVLDTGGHIERFNKRYNYVAKTAKN